MIGGQDGSVECEGGSGLTHPQFGEAFWIAAISD